MFRQTDDPLTVYCPACNAAFLGHLGEAQCPRCGMSVAPLANHSLNTLVYSTESLESSDLPARDHREDLSELIGTEIDRYQVESLLGRGGMGWVFLCRHLQLNRRCALKILSPSLVQKDLDYLDRFYSEGQAAASLNHPHIVTVHAIGQFQGMHYLEMEFVPGRSLQRIIDEQPLMPTHAATLTWKIAQGLAAAHRMGIVHRDLKPDNVLLTYQGLPKIGDFGLAKRLHGGAVHEVPGTLAGTPYFMAPELFSGREATPASDVYALGVTMFVMLAGHPPYTGHGIHALSAAIQNQQLPSIRSIRSDVSLELGECLGLLLEKSPANRPRDGIEAAQLLSAVLGQSRDMESLLHEAFHHEPSVNWKRDGRRFRAHVALPGDRSQTVFIEASQHPLAQRLLQIYSLCGPAESHYHAHALRLNSEIPHGAIALRNVEGQEYFVTLNNYPLGTADPEEIRRSVLELALHADAVELALTGQDRH